MAVPRREPMSLRIMLCSPFLSRNGYSKDFLMYDRDPGGLLVVLVIRCVNTMEAKIEKVHLIKEDGHEVNASVGCKAEGKSTAVTP